MALVPNDYPQRLAAAGLRVQVCEGWETRGSSADHRAVVFHWTASSASESPSSCCNYCMYAAEYAPDYNVLIDRTGVAWVGAREKANSSGEISSVALNEALRGEVDWRSAASRGLSDDTSANANLFAISAQNNGTGEPWSEALVHGMATAAAVTLECLGLSRSSFVTHHAALTRRKIDLTAGTGGCPDGGEWNERITDALEGRAPTEEADMWMTNTVVLEGGQTAQLQIPSGAKTVVLRVLVTRGDETKGKPGTFVVANRVDKSAKNVAVWNGELWINSYQRVDSKIDVSSSGVGVRNAGECQCSVALSGT